MPVVRSEFEQVVLAAAAVPVAARDAFLRAVAARLSSRPTDAEVQAVAAALG
jgi:hypothetical protein